MIVLEQILVMLLTLAVLIAFHEFGHFWVARRCGVKVLRFSIGFGPRLLTLKDKLGTEYSLSALPLGGYVKMLDEREDTVAEEDRPFAFNNKTVAQRMAIVSAGPIANFLLAIAVYWFVFLQGTASLVPVVYSVEADSIAAQAGLPVGVEIVSVDGEQVTTAQSVAMALLNRIGDSGDIVIQARYAESDAIRSYVLAIEQWLSEKEGDVRPLQSLGFGFYQPEIKPIVAEVMPESAALSAGLQAGDELLSMNGESIETWMQWVDYVRQRAGESIKLRYRRDGFNHDTLITPAATEHKGQTIGMVGIRVDVPEVPKSLIRKQEYNALTAWVPALKRTWDTAVFSLTSLKKMLLGDISYKQLSGPISIAKVATQSAQSGIYSYLSLLALLSVSLGVLNLLPIPVLDGGHILFYLIEWLKGSPVPEKLQVLSYQFGAAIVIAVMLLAVVNDIGRL